MTKPKEMFVGRQPIFNRQNDVYGYELLFRGGFEPNIAEFDSETEATATVVNNSIMGFGLDDLVGNHKAFINFPQSYFHAEAELCFSPENIVCEVLENVQPTESVLQGLDKLKKEGFCFALDDFVFKKEFIPFIKLSDYIKIDIETLNLTKLPLILQKIKSITSAKLIAERVETSEQHQICMDAGFDYFQGFYFAQPEIISGAKLDIARQSLMELLNKLTDEDIMLDELVEIIAKDVGLSHKLLKLAAQYRTRNMPSFSTLKEVVVLFGFKRVKSWAAMISMSSLHDISPETFNVARIRAIFMRNYAQHKCLDQIDAYYLTGLFSVLDTILHLPMEKALSQLPLSTDIVEGILHGTGEHGKLLNLVKTFEQGSPDQSNPVTVPIYLKSVKESYFATS